MSVRFRPFAAGDVVQLDLQPSQHVTLGVLKDVHTVEDGRELEEAGPAWTAIGADGRILCCYGFATMFPASERGGGQGLAWALLTNGIGAAHVAITRYARRTIENSSFSRIEALVRAGVEAECRWAELVGFKRAALLRAWGPEAQDHVLYDHVRAH